MENGHVKVDKQSGIATISFFHPQSNSLPGALLRELGDTITRVSNDSEAVVIVLRSEGEKAFCAGASFDELIAIQDLEGGTRFFSGFAHVINAIQNPAHAGKLDTGVAKCGKAKSQLPIIHLKGPLMM